ncbi:UDP-glucuronosyltransferase [Paenibacillus athensensis]|uniref:UDP-glucuronosyltransferase n=1 Tax=Paenibacillus athensensis TaxID=1967502 RepID=A0A4Y8QAF2_9BACL|nr:UDP-glucuronosyltransferase [Paenibacillus athensensis]MCD1257606.1 UDP-glucuronosyltransferase [Paenibacillus athensensis]
MTKAVSRLSKTITILSSGFGLGFYIPALLLERQLQERGVNAEVVVFEQYIVADKKERIAANRQDYHENFAVALVAQKMPTDIRSSIDFPAVEKLLDRWQQEERRDFIIFSGHWVYVIDMYRERLGGAGLNADLLYVDAGLSPSWKGIKRFVPDYAARYREVWLFDAEAQDVRLRIPVSGEPVVPYEAREPRLVLHGGGWGMGTYLSKAEELESRAYGLDIVIAHADEAKLSESNRYYMNDPAWEAWEKDPEAGAYIFPKFGQIVPGQTPEFTSQSSHHRLYDVIRQAKAVISKPGGATLIDSLSSATPIVFLDPFGPHEQKNADLWIRLGFGVSYETWQQSGYAPELLESLHQALLAHRTLYPLYLDTLLQQA